MNVKEKVNKIKPLSKQWIKEAHELALSRVTIYACGKCNHPVIDGYRCEFCGDSNPNYNIKGLNVSEGFVW